MTTATTIYLVRHGVTSTTGKVLPGRALGLHLSATGQTQARTVAERLSALRRPPTAVSRGTSACSSTTPRAPP